MAGKLPKSAADLVKVADANEWRRRVVWNIDSDGCDFVTVTLSRSDPLWRMQMTWHSRATNGRRLQLFNKIYMHVPIDGVGFDWREAPPLYVLTKIITDNPAITRF